MRQPELLWFFITAWLLFVYGAHATTDQGDVTALNIMFSSLNSPGQLNGWNANGGDPCAQSWKGVTCSGSAVTELHLSGLGLNGGIGYNLDKMTSLTILDLSNNNVGNGGQIPYQLPPNLRRLDLSGNNFGGGGLPYSINDMTSLEYLSVNRNQLTGNINDMFGKLTSLKTLDLSNNQFSGSLPWSFRSLSSLTKLNLQNNQLSGTLDVLVDLNLDSLNIANNRFSGWIPEKLNRIRDFQSGGNSWNSGPAPPSAGGSATGEGSSSGSDKGGKSGLSGGGIAGIIISLLVVGSIVAFFIIKRKSKKSSPDLKLEQDPLASHESNEMKPMQTFPDTSITVHVEPSVPTLKPPPVDRPKSFDDGDGDFTNKNVARKTNNVSINAVKYSVADLQMATGSFSVENLLGEGSMGRVYKAQFDDGKVLAVKKVNSSVLSSQASDFFMEVVSDISRLHHPNVSQLVGYCSEHGQHLLVFEFHRNGSLHDFLHLSDEYNKPLTWNTRVKIALGSARALEYLHEVSSPSVVHKNFKSANILLDGELNPHLSDSGLSKLTATLEYQALDQYLSSGYSAPEVAMSGQYTLKSDVFSFGVVMLELLTGRKPFDSSRPRSEQSLVRWATPQLHDIDALDKMVDPALKGLYPAKSLSRFADVIALCVQSEPEFRPPMSEVVQALVRLVQRANMSKRMGAMDDQEAARRSDDGDSLDTF